ERVGVRPGTGVDGKRPEPQARTIAELEPPARVACHTAPEGEHADAVLATHVHGGAPAAVQGVRAQSGAAERAGDVGEVRDRQRRLRLQMVRDQSRRARTSIEHAVSAGIRPDRKSTRLNSSHVSISYAVFCLKKKKTTR